MTHTIAGTTIRLLQGDITDQAVDAVVNAANSSLMGGGGVDGAIHRRGGSTILDACRAIRRDRYPDGMPTGQAVLTTGGDLPAIHVIHTVGPVWHGGSGKEADLLADAYRNALSVARLHGLRTMAFPSISTGAYGFPIDRAARIALRTIVDTVSRHPEAFTEIRMVLFTASDFDVYRRALDAIAP